VSLRFRAPFSIRSEYKDEQPLAGSRIAGCLLRQPNCSFNRDFNPLVLKLLGHLVIFSTQIKPALLLLNSSLRLERVE
jgi:hypothetical protein